MEAYGKGPSKKELNIRSLESECHKQEPRAGAAVPSSGIRDPLQKVCSSIWGGKRSEPFSFSFDEVTDTRQKKKKYLSFPVFCFCGALTVTHSHWVNKLQRLNCILEQGTSESYNKTGLDGKTGVNLTSVHRFVWCLYTAFLPLPLVPTHSHAQSPSLFKSDSEPNNLCCETPCPLAPGLTKMPVVTQYYLHWG